MLLVAAVAPIFGAMASLLFVYQTAIVLYALAFLVGSFFYMGAGSLLPYAIRMKGRNLAEGFFVFGFSIVLVISLIVAG